MKKLVSALGPLAKIPTTIIAILTLIIFSGVSGAAYGTVLYDNAGGFPDLPEPSSFCSPCSGQYQVYQPFTLSSESILTGTEFAIGSGYPPYTRVGISIWNGALNNRLYSTISSDLDVRRSIFSPGVPTIPRYDVISTTLENVRLAAGDYYISYEGSPDLLIPTFASGQNPFVQSSLYGRSNPSVDLVTFYENRSYFGAFDIMGNVVAAAPEPSTWAMMLLGFGTVGVAMRRRRGLSDSTANAA